MDLDPKTALIAVCLMMLLNGAVLGFMHLSLSRDVRASAQDWRIGTLLMAGGSILVAFQASLAAAFMLPVANGFLFVGITLYWRSIRRFHGIRDSYWIFVPAALGTFFIYWFAVVTPNVTGRVVSGGLVWSLASFSTAWILHKELHRESAISRMVLAVLFVITGGFAILRAIIFLFSSRPATAIVDSAGTWNAFTPLLIAILPVIGTTAFLLLCSERLRAQWERAAATDDLTGLPNRRTINAMGRSRFNAVHRSGAHFAVAVVDLDHFKSINDRFGHDAGDRALKHAATVLEKSCRGPNMLGRQGGEEFVALLDEADAAGARAAAVRLRQAVEAAPLDLEGGAHIITASIGVGLVRPEDSSFDDVLRRADEALYAAKAAGRNRVEVRA